MSFLGSWAFAAEDLAQSFTYQGRLMNAAGTAPLSGPVDIRVQIIGKMGAEECVLYDETQLAVALTQGVFSIRVGEKVAAASKRVQAPSSDPGFTLAQVFNNSGVLAIPGNCSLGTANYTPVSGDVRYMRVSVNSGAWTTLTPDQTINSVPHALVAETLMGYGAGAFLRLSAVDNTAAHANATKANFESLVNGSDIPNTLHHHDSRYFRKGAGGDSLAGDVSGTTNATSVDKIKGVAVNNAAIGAGKILQYNGTDLVYVNPPATGMTSINGDSTAAQTLTTAYDATYLAPAYSTAAGTHTLKYALASDAGVTHGLLSNAQYTALNAKVAGSGTQWKLPVWNNAGGTTLGDSLVSQNAGATLVTVSSAAKITGALDMSSQLVNNVLDPVAAQDAATKAYADSLVGAAPGYFIKRDGTNSPTADIPWNAKKITGLADPAAAQDAATKNYVDTKLITKTLPAVPGAGEDMKSLRYNNTSGNWEWFTAGVAGAGLTSINGETGGAQTLTTSNDNTQASPTWVVSAANTQNLKYPMASAAGVTAGLLSKADYDTFNSKFSLPALTNGSVLFSNGATIAQDNANFFWDDTNNRLGIGTTTPSFPLEVNNSARIGTTAKHIDLSGNDGGGQERPAGVGIISSDHNLNFTAGSSPGNSIGIYYYDGTPFGYRSAFEVASTAAGYGNILLLKSGGNVGIGSTNPTARLHLPAGAAAVSSAPLKFEPTGATIMAAPENGAMEFDGTDYYLTAGGTRNKIMVGASSAGVTGSGTQYFVPLWSNAGGTALGNSLISQDAGATTATVTAGKNFVVDTNTIFVDGTNHRLGIGHTAPLTPLDVRGNIRNSVNATDYVNLNVDNTFAANKTQATFLLRSDQLAGQSAFIFDTSAYGATGSYKILDIRDQGASKANFASNGDLTANTISSSNGFLAGANNGTLSVRSGLGSTSGGTPATVVTSTTSHGTAFQVQDNSTALVTVRGTDTTNGPAGAVGIGTTAPSAMLHLPAGATGVGRAPLKFEPTGAAILTAPENGAMEFDGTDYYLTAGGTRKKVNVSAGGAGDYVLKAGDTMSGDLVIAANKGLTVDTNTIYVDTTNHRVGIGTLLPGAKLTVSGGSAVFGSGIFTDTIGTTTVSDITLSAGAAKDVVFAPSSAELSRFTADKALQMNGTPTASAPAVSAASKGRIYFDSTTNTFKASESGAAYADLLTANSTSGPFVLKTGDTMTGKLQFNSGGSLVIDRTWALTNQGGAVDGTQTTIPAVSTANYPSSGYISLGSEVMSYTSKDATNFLGVTRGRFGTAAVAHGCCSGIELITMVSKYADNQYPGFNMNSDGGVAIGKAAMSWGGVNQPILEVASESPNGHIIAYKQSDQRKYLRIGWEPTTNYGFIDSNDYGGGTNPHLILQPNGEIFEQRVGIGTTAPTSMLHVAQRYNGGADRYGSTLELTKNGVGGPQYVGGAKALFTDNSTSNAVRTEALRAEFLRSSTGVSTTYDAAVRAAMTVNDGAGGTLIGVYSVGPSVAATKSVTNWYGLKVDAPSGAGTVTNKYALATEAGAGNVGIGTTAPSAKLQVAGQIVSEQNVVAAGNIADFNTGNVQVLEAPGNTVIDLQNMKDGGAYTVIVTDTTSRTYTFPACTNAYFQPTNAATTNRSVYTLLKVTLGGTTTCFISWITGFN